MTKESASKNETGPANADDPVSVVHGFKGFDKNLQCRGFQFEEGKTFKHDGPVIPCESGFHFCENPIDIFSYYPPADSVFHSVSGTGEVYKHDHDSKVACSEIKIGAAVSFKTITDAAFEFVFSRCKTRKRNHVTRYRTASSATG